MCQSRVRRRTLHPATAPQKNAVPDMRTQKKTGAAAPAFRRFRGNLEARRYSECELSDVRAARRRAVRPVVELRRLAGGQLRVDGVDERPLGEVVRRTQVDLISVRPRSAAGDALAEVATAFVHFHVAHAGTERPAPARFPPYRPVRLFQLLEPPGGGLAALLVLEAGYVACNPVVRRDLECPAKAGRSVLRTLRSGKRSRHAARDSRIRHSSSIG